jgi:hypothetical protein
MLNVRESSDSKIFYDIYLLTPKIVDLKTFCKMKNFHINPLKFEKKFQNVLVHNNN